jgi:hypothetical protein
MKISMKSWIVAGIVSTAALSVILSGGFTTAEDAEAAKSGQLTEESLGNLLEAMGLEPKKEEKRYDFNFKALYEGEEWELTMSTVLSENGQSIWMMAWLDELPRSAADVPRTALLRLLAQNDRLGKGKFFAYISSNRRFVLQRVVDNQNMTTTSFRDMLKDLGGSVVETYPHWEVDNWAAKPETGASQALPASTEKSAPADPHSSGKTGGAKAAKGAKSARNAKQ